ncbi:MAG: MarR family transcriptional regulator [Moraxellaceae bacterium]|nr:MarR family transcriptional regulator [Moraxellaceae bacterium]
MNNPTLDCQLLENQLCHRFYVIANAITRAYRPMLNRLDLTYPQYVVMMALWEKDDISISDLHQKAQIDIGCLSLMLKKMVGKNLIQLIVTENDRRMKKVKLTKKGQALQITAEKEKLQLQCQQPLNLEEEEVSQLFSLLDKLKANFKEV